MMAGLAALALGARGWLAARPWRAIAHAALPWLALAAGIAAALFAVERHGFARGAAHERPIAFAAGEKAERAIWIDAQAQAAAEHRRRARAIETRQAAAGVKVGEDYARDIIVVHAGYRQLRDAASRGATGRADLPGIPGAAGGAAQPGGADLVVTDPAQLDRAGLAPRLIGGDDVDRVLVLLEEGDVYRRRVLAWQQWYAEVSAAAQAPPE